eukprot:4857446-Amphidinium_carterae.2
MKNASGHHSDQSQMGVKAWMDTCQAFCKELHVRTTTAQLRASQQLVRQLDRESAEPCTSQLPAPRISVGEHQHCLPGVVAPHNPG